MTVQIETALCTDCGVDTRIDGFVNRVPRDTGMIDGYVCGSCNDAYEDAQVWYDNSGRIVGRGEENDPRFDDEGEEVENSHEFERSLDDAMYNKYEAQRHAEVDAMFPDAPKFREWISIDMNEKLSDVQVKQIQELVDNYRYNEDSTLPTRNTVGGVLENLLRR